MGQMSSSKLEIVRSLLEQAPDHAVRSLLAALTSDGRHDEAMAGVQHIIEIEAAERRARNMAFAPIAPLCGSPGPFNRLHFPTRTLALIWKALKDEAPHEIAAAHAATSQWRDDESSPEIFNMLCARAAEGLRGRSSVLFAQAAESADAGGGNEALAACLDLARVTRGALHRMPEWLGRMTSEKSAALRLAYRDAVALSDDAGPRFFEMLAAHLNEPWLILRIISGVMDHPNETYLSASELASFGERVMDDIDRRLTAVTAFKAPAGRAAAYAAAAAVHVITAEINEFEQSIAMKPEGVWGRRVARQKRAMANAIEAQLKITEDAVAHALPLQTVRLGPRAAKGVPKLVNAPDPILVEKASTLLIFMSEVRASANNGGFASARAKALESLETRLDQYVEDILEEIRSEDCADRDRARAYLEIAADLCGLARDEKAAQIVRRRAAAA